MKIHDLPNIDRPREKLEKYGPEKLSSAELLAMVLRTGVKGMSAVEVAKKILKEFPEKNIAQATVDDLRKSFGLGTAKACEIVACFELGRRMLQNKQSVLLLTPKDVWDALGDVRDSKKEHFVIFFLDARNQEIKRETVSIGSLNANLVHPREVFEPAIRHLAAQVIVAHNHPSGNTDPSDADKELTRRLADGGRLLGIELLDHVIVCRNSHLSMKEAGFM